MHTTVAVVWESVTIITVCIFLLHTHLKAAEGNSSTVIMQPRGATEHGLDGGPRAEGKEKEGRG